MEITFNIHPYMYFQIQVELIFLLLLFKILNMLILLALMPQYSNQTMATDVLVCVTKYSLVNNVS